MIGALILASSAAVALVAAAPSAAAPEGAKPAPEVRVAVRDERGGKVSRYATALLRMANERLGWNLSFVGEQSLDGFVWKKSEDIDIVASALYTPEIAAEYTFVRQALGSVRISLFAKAETKDTLAGAPPHAWPRLRLAYARGMLDPNGEFQNWCDRKAVTALQDVCYPTREDAEKAVRSDECTMLLASAMESVEGLEEVAMLRRLPCFMAVSKRKPELWAALSAELERIYVDELPRLDQLRREALGVDRSVKRVVVGRYLEDGYSRLMPDGTFSGANEEIIERMASLNGWTVDWVACDGRKALEYLAQGKIDLLAGVAMDDKRQERIHFPHIPCGVSRAFLYARPELKYMPQRFDGWDGMDIATGPDELGLSVLRGFLNSRGVKYSLTVYPSGAEAEKAFYQGRHSVLHAVGTHRLDNEKQLAAFSLVPNYVCCAKGRTELVSTLENTLVRIANETPGFFESVWSRHFITDELRETSFSPEEHAWIRSCVTAGSVVRVDISPVVPPLKDWDPATGQPRGFVNAFFEELTRRSGLHFMFLPPASELVARRRLLDGESDILVSLGSDLSDYDDSDVVGSLKLDMLLVCRRGGRMEGLDPTSGRIALPNWNRAAMQSLRSESIGSYLFSCRDDMSCFKAVRNGDADCTYATVFTALACMKELGLERELETRRVTRGRRTADLALLSSPSVAPELRSSLRKTLASFDAAQIQAFISRTLYESTTRPLVSFPGAFAVALMVVALAAVAWSVRRTRLIQRQQRGIAKRDRMIAARDESARRTFAAIKGPLDEIEARAEYLRTPDAARDQMLQWTEELIRGVESIVHGLNEFMGESGTAKGPAKRKED
ncbi:MAG: hypothetical protein K6G91_08415 [Kiritimatiellae bacterium]|nr:hypothetical protein [Kiritimatiellia bacterium]